MEKVGMALTETLSESELTDVLGEVAEVGIDSILEEGAARDLPVIGAFLGIVRTYGTVRDYLFARKLLLFLKELSGQDEWKAKAAVRKWEADHGFDSRVGETLIELLDRVDGDIKPRWVAVTLKAYGAGDVDWEDMLRINNALMRILKCDLAALDSLSKGLLGMADSDSPSIQNLVSAGLCYFEHCFGGPKPVVTKLGLKFKLIVDETEI